MLANPQALFRHDRGTDMLSFHSTSPLPPEAEITAQEVMRAVAVSPLGAPTRPIRIFMVDEGWPVRLFFVGSPDASGLTYPVISTRNVFLRYVDLPAGRLSFRGHAVPPPRTLHYYLVHEVAHLVLAERVGRLRIASVPRWINEGVADYVALGPAPPVMVALAAAGHPLPQAVFGSYPLERVCVSLALDRLDGDLDVLLALDAGMAPGGSCPDMPQIGIAPVGPGT